MVKSDRQISEYVGRVTQECRADLAKQVSLHFALGNCSIYYTH